MNSKKQHIRREFIQAVLMTSESMIQQGVTVPTAKSNSERWNFFVSISRLPFYINIFFVGGLENLFIAQLASR